MYIAPINQPDALSDVEGFMRDHGFATLISSSGSKPLEAMHLPLYYSKADGQAVLQGHVSKANQQYNSLINNDALAIFMPGHHYISPNWYTQRNVPTWNYVAIHVYGKCIPMEGDALLQHLASLMDFYEKSQETPHKMQDIPEKILRTDLRGLLGFELQIEQIEAAFKLSQNRDDESYHNVVAALEQIDSNDSNFIAQQMKIRRP